MRIKSNLRLSNGECFTGDHIGAPLESSGELVFTTGMVGYTEALTDPSYFGQILVFTYPLIGNYGIPEIPKELTEPIPRGFESSKVHASAVIVTIDSEEAFHWTSLQSLDSWLKEQQVPGIVGLDTRHLVHIVRNSKKLLGKIDMEGAQGHRSFGNIDAAKKGEFFDPSEHNIVSTVSTPERKVLFAHRSIPASYRMLPPALLNLQGFEVPGKLRVNQFDLDGKVGRIEQPLRCRWRASMHLLVPLRRFLNCRW